MRLTKFNPETGQYEYIEKAKTLDEYRAQRKAAIQKLGELEDKAEKVDAIEFTCIFGQPHKVSDCPIVEEIEKTKADTVRKMQERLKADAVTIRDHTGKLGVVVGVGNIDDVAREMLEVAQRLVVLNDQTSGLSDLEGDQAEGRKNE